MSASPSSSAFEVSVPLDQADIALIDQERQVQYKNMRRFLIISLLGVGAVIWTYMLAMTVLMFFVILLLLPLLFIVWVVFKKARLLKAEQEQGTKNRLTTSIVQIKMLSTNTQVSPAQTYCLLVVGYPYEKEGTKMLGMRRQSNYLPKEGEQTVIDYLPRSTFVLTARMTPTAESGISSSPE